jgi:S-DNA-T family DNA segregation ATPase FtsK/SpoIIIE
MYNTYLLRRLIANKLPVVFGLAIIAISLFLLIALSSYSPTDSSFNRASAGGISNLAGKYGSYIADPLLQFIGLGSIVLVLLPLIWGWRLVVRGHISLFWLRVIMSIVALISLSAIISLVDISSNWIFSSYGGLIGKVIEQELLKIVHPMIFVGGGVTLLFLTFIFAAGLNIQDWKRIGKVFLSICIVSYKIFRIITKPIIKFLKRNKKEEFVFEEDLEFNEELDEFVEEKPKQLPSMLSEIKSTLKSKKTSSVKESIKKTVFKIAESKFQLPLLSFLNLGSEKSTKNYYTEEVLKSKCKELEQVLEDFGIHGKIVAANPGPVVTLYELEPAAGTKSSRVIGLADDIARSMSAISARIAVVPGRNVIGIELPNIQREIVYLREILASKEYQNDGLNLPIVLGKDIAGKSVVVDLSKMPHLLVAGTTGSGKSVAINTMILSLLYRLPPESCKFIMIDPKMLELSVYDGIPHLLAPVVTEPGKAVVALKWTVKEMENRYRLMSNIGVRNIAGYNKRIEDALINDEKLERVVQTGFDPETGKPIYEKVALDMQKLPYIVVIVDEMADLMIVAGKDIESSIQRLAQMARAAGIHIIMATQRPSVDVITGVIKANFPTRISFQVTSRIDSRTILGEPGAEQLLGMGDMLYMSGGSRITRVHGPYVDEKEVEKIVEFLKEQGAPNYIEEVTTDEDSDEGFIDEDSEKDELYDQAVAIISRDRKASTSYIQRCLRIGYNRAATIIEKMEREGIVSKANHVGKREVLVPETD